MSFNIFEKYYEKIICMNKQEFDHFIISIDDPELLLNIIINFIRIKETHKSLDANHNDSINKIKIGVKKKKKIIDYINSSSMAVMIKRLGEMKYQCSALTIMSIINKIITIKNCLIYALLNYIYTLDDIKVSTLLVEESFTLINKHKLWINNDNINFIEKVINDYSTHFINPNKIIKISSYLINLNFSNISIFENESSIINSTYSNNLQILYDMINSSHKNKQIKYFKSLDTFLSPDKINHIVDGHNIFYDTTEKKTDALTEKEKYIWYDYHMINMDKLEYFIKKYKNEHVVLVFYQSHQEVLNDIIIKYESNPEFDTKFLFTKKGIDDDRISIYLWLKNINNILHTYDQFHNHVKHFANDIYWYSLWRYHFEKQVIAF